LIESKDFLVAGIPEKAYEGLRRSKALAPSSQVRALLVGLRIAPRSTVLAACFWPRAENRGSCLILPHGGYLVSSSLHRRKLLR
jgi:hypothetical protein